MLGSVGGIPFPQHRHAVAMPPLLPSHMARRKKEGWNGRKRVFPHCCGDTVKVLMRVGYKMTVEASRSPSKPRLQRLRMAFHHHACLPEGAISSPRCRPDGGGGRTTKTYRPPERHNGWLIVNTNRGYIGSPFQRDCCFS